MISQKMQDTMNEQIVKEFYSAYLYLSMEAYFASENLNGFAHHFQVQAQEERDHAMKFFNYITHVGNKVNLGAIDAPQTNFNSALEAFEITLAHEKIVTASINNLVNISIEEKDHTSNIFLQWYITEQAEEEATADAIIKKLKLIKGDGMGLLMMDAELAKRVYNPIPTAPGNNSSAVTAAG